MTFLTAKYTLVADSFILLTNESSPDVAIEKLHDVLDYSNFPKDDPRYTPDKKNQLGYLKCEVNGDEHIVKFAGVKAKSYMVKTNKTAVSKAKGVKKGVKDSILFEDYKRVIMGAMEHEITQYSLLAKNYVNRMVKMNKVAFTSLDDKRFQLCEVHSVPYGSRMSLTPKHGKCILCKYAQRGKCFI